jgi:Lrp/AsnC family transcriptional regulator, leucine-responsive regulatory protein
MKRDMFDRHILDVLQRDGSIGPAEMSEIVHLSASQCSRRMQRLRRDGLIRKTVAIVDRHRVDLGVLAVVLVRLVAHASHNEHAFRAWVEATPEVLSCHYVAGDLDFILHIATHDLASYDRFLSEHLLHSSNIASYRSNVILKTLKESTELPLSFFLDNDKEGDARRASQRFSK